MVATQGGGLRGHRVQRVRQHCPGEEPVKAEVWWPKDHSRLKILLVDQVVVSALGKRRKRQDILDSLHLHGA
jgi:hypothetical protein